MTERTVLYLIRHGEVEPAYHKVFGGKIDMDLSPLGLEQVEALGRWFNNRNIEVLYSSPMKRAQKTAAPLAQITGLTPCLMDDLREVDFGVWTGLSWEQVQSRFNISAFEWLNQLEINAIAEAESTAAFRERIEAALTVILRTGPAREVAVVCHGGVIRMILAVLLDLPFRKMAAFDFDYASVSKIHYSPGKVEVQLLNFTPWS